MSENLREAVIQNYVLHVLFSTLLVLMTGFPWLVLAACRSRTA